MLGNGGKLPNTGDPVPVIPAHLLPKTGPVSDTPRPVTREKVELNEERKKQAAKPAPAKPVATIQKTRPAQGTVSKTVEVLAHPFQAASYAVKGQRIPDNFSKGDGDGAGLDAVGTVVNPVAWARTAATSSYTRTGDVATDLMQLGNFIPHPMAQRVARIGNVAGAFIDGSQALSSAVEGDWSGAGVNAASALLPSVLNTRLRNAKYINQNLRGVYYVPLDKQYGRMSTGQLWANRLLLSGLAAETIYDAK